MVSVWIHRICPLCWNERRPAQTVPVILGAALCCFCGEYQAAGLHVRENPAHLVCKGRHAPERRRAPDCEHVPGDPEAPAGTLCWHCGALIRYDGEKWKSKERTMAHALPVA